MAEQIQDQRSRAHIRKVAVAVKLGFRKKILKQIRNPDQITITNDNHSSTSPQTRFFLENPSRAQIVERVVKSHKYGATVVLSRAVMAALYTLCSVSY
ncbi:hypothetical protein C5167_031948 [Papaver somniferum]|uniref:Uncharacterized protein n=1 Tax=Papaver somniferum TaxID=3469 RepID=A0A4Y7K615_PAPSO|nr:hypothetical protein C5167_031948 [Papaver somniferum]